MCSLTSEGPQTPAQPHPISPPSRPSCPSWMPKSPQNSAPNLPPPCHPGVTLLPTTCHADAQSQPYFVTPPTACGAARHTPIDPSRTSVLRFPQQRTDLSPAHTTHPRSHLRRTHPLPCTQAPSSQPPADPHSVPERPQKVTVWHTSRHTLEQPSSYEMRAMVHSGTLFAKTPARRGNPLWLPLWLPSLASSTYKT